MQPPYFQVIHQRRTCHLNSGYHVYPSEWDAETGTVLGEGVHPDRKGEHFSVRRKLEREQIQLKGIIREFTGRQKPFTSGEIVTAYHHHREQVPRNGFVDYCEQLIIRMLALGKKRTAEKLRTCLNSFLRFLE